MVRFSARLYVSIAYAYFLWSLYSSAFDSSASRTSVSPKFYSASLIFSSRYASSSSKVFSIYI